MSVETLAVDYSTLRTVASCDTQAAMRYALHFTSPAPALARDAGSAIHAALAAWLRGAGIDEAMEAADDYADIAAAAAVEASDRLAAPNVMRVLRRWLETHPLATLPWSAPPEWVEVRFSMPLDAKACGGPTEYRGRLDACGLVGAAWWVVDHKSSGAVDERAKRRWRMEAQFTGYVVVAEHMLRETGMLGEREHVAGTLVNAIEVRRLPSDGKRRCATHGVLYAECGELHAWSEVVPIEAQPEREAAWRADVARLVSRWRALRQRVTDVRDMARVAQQGAWNGSCSWCEFYEWCRGGRDAEWATRNLVVKPWTPGGPEGGDGGE